MWATGGKGHRSLRGAYARLTRRKSQKSPGVSHVCHGGLTVQLWCLDCVCSAIRFWIVYVCVELDCSLVLALLRGVLMYIYNVFPSKLTHGLRKRFPYKKLTQPYARAGFAYAELRYDNTLIKHEHGGLSNGSIDLLSVWTSDRTTKSPDPVRVEARHRHHIAAGKGCGDHVEQQGNGVHVALEFRHANMPQQVSNNRNSQL